MTKVLQAVRGMNDILPDVIGYWHLLEATLIQIANAYGYQEIRVPIVEQTELFARAVGEVTDIVEKEMYTFLDRDKASLTLRPEWTAGCIRAGIEHGLFYNQVQRLWYLGPVFRHERPQRGRYRQFYQFGVEAIGIPGAAIDAELILLNARIWKALGLSSYVTLQLNSLGSVASRKRYRETLIEYFSRYRADLDADSQRRLYTNPLRILDTKNPAMQEIIQTAPALLDYLDEISRTQFELLQDLLTQAAIPFVLNPRLVRGLDYYTDTVFEWVTTELGAQGTVSAGGRYDGLIEQLGGNPTPAIGFSMGCERVIELLRQSMLHKNLNNHPDLFFIVSEDAHKEAILIAEKIHDAFPTVKLLLNLTGGSFKSQFKRADKSGAKIAIILAENELKTGTVTMKFLREERDQQSVSKDDLLNVLPHSL